jgi:predicted DNA-binding transcriptional regulator AlpA
MRTLLRRQDEDERKREKKRKRYLRKQQVAQRYGIDERTADRWKLDGRLPPPVYRGRIPLWDELELDESDRHHAELSRSSKAA